MRVLQKGAPLFGQELAQQQKTSVFLCLKGSLEGL